jgi:hypothetical protein
VVLVLAVWAGLTCSPVATAICVGCTVVQSVRSLALAVVVDVVVGEGFDGLEQALTAIGSTLRAATDRSVRRSDK